MRQLQALFRHEAGAVALIFALATPVAIGGAALATDTASLVHQRSRLQNVADSAALAGANELRLFGTDEDTVAATTETHALALLREQRFEGPSKPIAVAVDAKLGTVRVTVELEPQTLLLTRLGLDETIAASAQAHVFGSSRLCVLTLEPAAADTLKIDRIATLNAAECAVQSNSTDSRAIVVTLLSKITATDICSSGGISGPGNAFNPDPQTDCPKIEDPLVGREPPPVGGCDFNNRKLLLGLRTISPGRYCGGLKLLPGALVRAEPGEYIISGGPLQVGLAASLTGEDVSFRFLDDAATFNFGLGSIINLSAPRQGPMAGYLFYQDRTTSKGRVFTIATDLATNLLGTIYLPNGTLKIDVVGLVAGQSAYTIIVADRLDVKGAELVINSDYGITDVPVPSGVGPRNGQVALER